MKKIAIVALLCFLLGVMSGYFLFKRECSEPEATGTYDVMCIGV